MTKPALAHRQNNMRMREQLMNDLWAALDVLEYRCGLYHHIMLRSGFESFVIVVRTSKLIDIVGNLVNVATTAYEHRLHFRYGVEPFALDVIDQHFYEHTAMPGWSGLGTWTCIVETP